MIKIAFLDQATIGHVDNIKLISGLGKLVTFNKTKEDEVLERCKGMDVLIVNKVELHRELLEQLPGLKLICITATGMNNVDLDYAKEAGIEVRNVAGYSTDSVAQLAFTMLLYLVNSPAYYDKFVKTGEYSRSGVFTHHDRVFWELRGKRMGIIGLGNIGRQVAKIAEGFGMEVVFHSTSGRNNHVNYKRFELDDLLISSDVVSVHAPLNEQTLDLIHYEKLKLMRPCAILLNLGRGGIVNEVDLARALDEDLIAAAGTDVLVNEPIDADNPLLKIRDQDKILITPHMAWASKEARELLMEKTAANISDFLRRN